MIRYQSNSCGRAFSCCGRACGEPRSRSLWVTESRSSELIFSYSNGNDVSEFMAQRVFWLG